VRVDAVPDRDLTGTLKDISVVAKPDFTTWPPVRNFDVVVTLTDADARLRSGMSASARVELDRLASVLVVPTAGSVVELDTKLIPPAPSADGHWRVNVSTCAPSATRMTEARPIDVASGHEAIAPDVKMQLRPAVRVSGRVSTI
jgi:hypothetical protein